MLVASSLRNLPKIGSEPFTLENKILGININLPIMPKENIESRQNAF